LSHPINSFYGDCADKRRKVVEFNGRRLFRAQVKFNGEERGETCMGSKLAVARHIQKERDGASADALQGITQAQIPYVGYLAK
jgi:hypothetical protein